MPEKKLFPTSLTHTLTHTHLTPLHPFPLLSHSHSCTVQSREIWRGPEVTEPWEVNQTVMSTTLRAPSGCQRGVCSGSAGSCFRSGPRAGAVDWSLSPPREQAWSRELKNDAPLTPDCQTVNYKHPDVTEQFSALLQRCQHSSHSRGLLCSAHVH